MLRWREGRRSASVVLGLLVVVLLFAAFNLQRQETAAEVPLASGLLLPGAIIQLESGFELDRVFSGQLMTYQDAGLGFEVGGVVDQVLVAEGDRVEAGQALARLRQAEQLKAIGEQEAVREQAEAVLEEARAQLRLAELVRERRLQLAERALLSKEAFETAEADLESQRARVRSAEASVAHARAILERLHVQLEQTELRAPHDGVVAALPARVGQSLEAGAPAARLVDLGRPHVHVGLPVALAATLAVGAQLTLVVADKRHAAELLSLAPVVDAPARTVLAVLRPAGALPTLRAGELVRVEVTERVEDQGAWLPLGALVEGRRGLWYGYFVRAGSGVAGALGGEVEQRPLQIVHTGGDRAFVRGPMAEGDIYLRSGLHRVVPGQHVRVVLD